MTKIHDQAEKPTDVYVDASLDGIGAYVHGWAYHARIPNCYKYNLSIVHYEIMNVLVAFRAWGVNRKTST